jgi:hypothetical protein
MEKGPPQSTFFTLDFFFGVKFHSNMSFFFGAQPHSQRLFPFGKPKPKKSLAQLHPIYFLGQLETMFKCT